jgi:hypothetical protein
LHFESILVLGHHRRRRWLPVLSKGYGFGLIGLGVLGAGTVSLMPGIAGFLAASLGLAATLLRRPSAPASGAGTCQPLGRKAQLGLIAGRAARR